MSSFRQGSVSGGAEIFSPLKINHLGGKTLDAFHRSIRATGIRDDNFVNQQSDTLQGAFDPILFILNDHAKRDTHNWSGLRQMGGHFSPKVLGPGAR